MSENATKLIAGRYRVVSQIGTGSYGVVYRAEDTVLQKTVAVKMLNLQGADPTVLIRFQNEARATAKLKHSSIVQILDFNSDGHGYYYLVLDFVAGKSLRSIIEEDGALTFNECFQLFVQILDGLEHAHKNGVIHRDLSPNNILVDLSNPYLPLAKIVDFGLAWLDNSDQNLTREGVAIGTPDYMSPEQCRGQEPDARSDIYSFGCLMFATLCGRPVYLTDTAIDTMMSHVNDSAPLLSDVRPEIDWTPGLEEIVEKTTARDPDCRFQSAKEVSEQLRAIARVAEERKATSELLTSSPKLAVNYRPASKGLPRNFWSLASCLVAVMGICFWAYINVFRGNNVFRDSSEISELFSPEHRDEKLDTEINRLSGNEYAYDHVKTKDSAARYTSPSLTFDGARYTAKNCWVDDDLKFLKSSRQPIRRLLVQQRTSRVEGSGLRYLSSLPLERLEIRDADLKDSFVDYLPRNLTSLRYLAVTGQEHIAGTTLGALSAYPNLDDLDLTDTAIADRALIEIAKLKNLKHLNLSKCLLLKGSTFKSLYELPKLNELNISASGISLDCVDILPFQNLNALMISDLPVSKEDVRRFLKNRHLHELYLDKCKIDDEVLKIIAADKQIMELSLKECPNITTRGLRYLASMSLTQLNYSKNALHDEDLHLLLGMNTLRKLKVYECGLSERQVRQLLQKTKIAEIVVSDPVTSMQVQILNSQYPGHRVTLNN